MVTLYGIVSGASLVNALGNSVGTVRITPSIELRNELLQLPSGTRIGLGITGKPEWAEVEEDLQQRLHEAHLSPDAASYPASNSTYWTAVEQICCQREHQVVPLESKDVWKVYNNALVHLLQCRDRYREEVEFGSEGLEDNDQKIIVTQEDVYAAEIAMRKIYELDRDEALLTSIAKQNIDVAIVGVGHTAFWMYDSEAIASRNGITFDSYCAEEPVNSFRAHPPVRFVRNPHPDASAIIGRDCLERTVRLLSTGRIIQDKTPTFVGIWDTVTPSRGYFEVFVGEEKDTRLSGTIEDCLGSAEFAGTLQGDAFEFTKKYTRAVPTAIKEPIFYVARINNKAINGRYQARDGLAMPQFYMERADKISPTDLWKGFVCTQGHKDDEIVSQIIANR